MKSLINNLSITAVLSVIFLGAGVHLSESHSLHAQVPKVTAGAVIGEDGKVNEDSLKAFVTWATSVFEGIETDEERTKLLGEVYEEGSDYNSGKIYVVLFATGGTEGSDGRIIYYGKNPNLNGLPALEVKDDEGNEVVKEMLKAEKGEEAIRVEYCWNDPRDNSDNAPGATCKPSYAMRYASSLTDSDLVVVGGYYQDLSFLTVTLPEDLEYPAVSASDVKDRETLKQFVEGTATWVTQLFESLGIAASQMRVELRKDAKDGGFFKDGLVYVYIITKGGYVIFHGFDAWREGRTVINNPDLRGDSTFVRRIIDTALNGGGYVDYYWNNPDDPNDDPDPDILPFDPNAGTLRTAYSQTLEIGGITGERIIAGAFFPSVITSVEDEITEIPTEFVLHGNYPNPFNPSTRIQFDLPERAQVTLQVMDVLGRKVIELPAQSFEAGANHTIELNAISLASGTYLYRMTATGAESRYERTGFVTLVK